MVGDDGGSEGEATGLSSLLMNDPLNSRQWLWLDIARPVLRSRLSTGYRPAGHQARNRLLGTRARVVSAGWESNVLKMIKGVWDRNLPAGKRRTTGNNER